MKKIITLKMIKMILLMLTVTPGTDSFSSPLKEEKVYDKEAEINGTPNATFTIPAGWRFDEKASTLMSPTRDLVLYLREQKRETSSPKDLDTLALHAWKEINPQFNYPIGEHLSPALNDGWESTRIVYYTIPVKEKRVALSITRIFNGIAYILLVDSSRAEFDKRQAQIHSITESWHPSELKKEDLSQNKITLFSSDDTREMNTFILHAMKELNLPGASVAIIQNDKMVYRQGFGVKKRGEKDKVTPETLFMIGSTTKPLTTLMLAKLVEQGKLTWDTPIQDVLPEFKLADEDITAKFQVKHTVCACTGMPRRDLEIEFHVFESAEDSLKLFHSMRPTTHFGETFQYSNTLVALGGFLGGRVYNKGSDLFTQYENAMNDLVFIPLGMDATRVKPKESDALKLANPHESNFDGKMVALPQTVNDMYYIDSPAGSIWSNIDDLSQYMMMELRKGKSRDGHVLFAEEEIMQRRTPGVKVDGETTYGLGLFLEKDKGISIIGHSGMVFGFTHALFFLPDYQVGMIIQTNAGNAHGFGHALQQKLLELLLRAQPKSEEMLQFSKIEAKQKNEIIREGVSIKAKDNEWIDSFVGDYVNADLGNVRIVKEKSSFKFITSGWSSDIATKTEKTGEKLLILTSANFLGMMLRVSAENGKKLILDDAQVLYEFSEIK